MKRSERPSQGPGALVANRYELLDVAGKGGMAVVWRAHQHGDRGFARPVAVKQMHDHLAEQPAYVDMFVEEARVGAVLHDPAIAQVYDFVAEDGQFYLVMEWVDGIDLGTYVKHVVGAGKKPPWELVAAVGIGMLRGLAAAHERVAEDGSVAPIVHRDISPHNILLTRKGTVKIIDFGLSLARDRGKVLTEPGIVKGKMSYLAPEIVMGKRPTPLSDQFATGSVLWEALVGRKLFEGESDFDTYKKLRDAEVEGLKPNRADVPAKLAKAIHRALSGHERDRFGSAREMSQALAAVLRTAKVSRDIHGFVAEHVKECRTQIRGEPESPSGETPVTALSGELSAEIETEMDGPRRGLRHRLPSFLRRRL